MSRASLTLAEELLLLSLCDDDGAVASSGATSLPFGLGGAVVVDLYRAGRIALEDDRIVVVSTESTGHRVLDVALRNLALLRTVPDARYWLARPNALVAGLEQRLLDGLVDRGILRREERRLLWIVPYHQYPTHDRAPESDLRRRIRAVALGGAPPDERTAFLLCLIEACRLDGEVFSEIDKSVERGSPVVAEAVARARAALDASAAAVADTVCRGIAAAVDTVAAPPRPT